MTAWETSELEKLGKADEIKLFSLKKEGAYYNPVTIWIVQVDNDLFVRSYKGVKGAWYQRALINHKGKVSAGKITKEVHFISISMKDNVVNDKIDSEYRSKYQKHGATYEEPMISSQATETTIKLDPF